VDGVPSTIWLEEGPDNCAIWSMSEAEAGFDVPTGVFRGSGIAFEEGPGALSTNVVSRNWPSDELLPVTADARSTGAAAMVAD
jgi:hypothetical protein